jgi:hypothetical protein
LVVTILLRGGGPLIPACLAKMQHPCIGVGYMDELRPPTSINQVEATAIDSHNLSHSEINWGEEGAILLGQLVALDEHTLCM